MTHARIIRGLLLSISVITLAACSTGESRPEATKTSAPMPPITEMDEAMQKPAPQPLPLSQSDTLTPYMPSATSAPTPAISAEIVKTTAEPAVAGTPAPSSVEARMAKLEETVGSLRADYDRIMPAFASLNTTNERIQALLSEIEKETGKRPSVSDVPASAVKGGTSAAPAVSAPAPGPADAAKAAVSAPVSATPEPAPAASASLPNSVTGVRIGEHGTKTRLVFDLAGKQKPEFKYDIDSDKKLLVLDMPNSSWGGSAASGKAARSPLVEGWSSQKGPTGGTAVTVQLKSGARVLSTEYLKPEGKNSARLVMDIAPVN